MLDWRISARNARPDLLNGHATTKVNLHKFNYCIYSRKHTFMTETMSEVRLDSLALYGTKWPSIWNSLMSPLFRFCAYIECISQRICSFYTHRSVVGVCRFHGRAHRWRHFEAPQQEIKPSWAALAPVRDEHTQHRYIPCVHPNKSMIMCICSWYY